VCKLEYQFQFMCACGFVHVLWPFLFWAVAEGLASILMNRHGRVISDVFMELPSRRDYPSYFELIRDPIDLKMIKVCLCVCGYLCMYASITYV